MPLEIKRFDSISAIDRNAWNNCFADELENYDYLLALERSHIKGFDYCYYVVTEGETLLAAVPAFYTLYDLSTTTKGKIRNILLAIARIAPKLFTLKLACLGSTATETCPIGFHPLCDEQRKHALFLQLIRFFKTDAASMRASLCAIKDVNVSNKVRFGDILASTGFHAVPGMPSAVLHINFVSIDDYLSSLSSATRKDMRRKLKKAREIRIEYRDNVDDIIDDIYAMYLETKNRSDLQFEELTPDYFRQVITCMNDRCLYAIYFVGEIAIGANLMLINNERLLDKFFCMRTQMGHDYNLYFVSWFANLQLCLDKGLTCYQSGQAGYETKLRLGSALLPNWMYFRHRNWLADTLLKLASPLLAFDIPEEKD